MSSAATGAVPTFAPLPGNDSGTLLAAALVPLGRRTAAVLRGEVLRRMVTAIGNVDRRRDVSMSQWPPAAPVFERDVPIDGAMFALKRTLYSIAVLRVTTARDLDGWVVQLEIRGLSISRVTLHVAMALLAQHPTPQRVALHVVDVSRDWVARPLAERPGFLEVR